MRKAVVGALVVLAGWVLAACTPPPADVVFVVNTILDTVDTNPGDGTCADIGGNCSLRAAVMESNAAPDSNEIQLASGTVYELTIPGTGEDASATGDLDITQPTYIRAPIGGAPATIDAGWLDRVLDIHSGAFHFLEGLVITHGHAAGTGSSGAGGGIRMQTGLVGIEDTRITANASDVNGGGVWAGNTGWLWVEDSTIDLNTALDSGGGIFARTSVVLYRNVTVDANRSLGPSFRAQIHQESGKLTAKYATITANSDIALFLGGSGTADIQSSIVAGAAADCDNLPPGAITSNDVIWSDATCGPDAGDVVEPVTYLAPLSFNGGPVPTRMPYDVAPFVDLVSGAAPSCTSEPFDSRQQPRPHNTDCDAGAVEAQAGEALPIPVPAVSITSPVAGENLDGNVTIEFTGTASDALPVDVTLYDAGDCTGSPLFSASLPHIGGGWTSMDTVPRGENLTLSVIARQVNGFGIEGNSGCVPFATRNGIWVRPSPTGNDANPGTKELPKATIQAGINAAAGGSGRVFVRAGTYNGATALALVSNVAVYGGFVVDGDRWSRAGVAGVPGSVSPFATVSSSSSNEGAVANADTNVVLDGLWIVAGSSTTPGQSSYGLRAVGGSTVTIVTSAISAGAGGNGQNGSSAPNGPAGGAGGEGGAACNDCGTIGAGGAGGTGARSGGSGGGGGTVGGGDGQNGQLGYGGLPGLGGTGDSFPSEACLGENEAQGQGGADGENAGPPAAGGSGGTISYFFDGGSVWLAESGTAGAAGQHGAAGGGGGGGAGDMPALFLCDLFGDAGAGGGGGGGGGSRGGGGAAGTAGGGSFGVYVNNSTLTISNSSIASSDGGEGGAGGRGGDGGAGGRGGDGGECGASTAGGGGGGGGAGAGGPSIAVFENGVGTVTITSSTLTKGFAGTGAPGGVGGGGGLGGLGGAAPTTCSPYTVFSGFAGEVGPSGASGGTSAGGSAFALRSFIDGVAIS